MFLRISEENQTQNFFFRHPLGRGKAGKNSEGNRIQGGFRAKTSQIVDNQ